MQPQAEKKSKQQSSSFTHHKSKLLHDLSNATKQLEKQSIKRNALQAELDQLNVHEKRIQTIKSESETNPGNKDKKKFTLERKVLETTVLQKLQSFQEAQEKFTNQVLPVLEKYPNLSRSEADADVDFLKLFQENILKYPDCCVHPHLIFVEQFLYLDETVKIEDNQVWNIEQTDVTKHVSEIDYKMVNIYIHELELFQVEEQCLVYCPVCKKIVTMELPQEN
jgi:hypothetical protein